MSDLSNLGGIHVPQIGHDPGVPTKREQFRMIAVQTVTQAVVSGALKLADDPDADHGRKIVQHAAAIYKFLDAGTA